MTSWNLLCRIDKTNIFILFSKYKSQVIELINLTLNLKKK